MPATFRCYQLKRSKDARKRCINLMSPKYSVIVAENKGFSSRNYLGLFLVDLGLFCHFLPGLALSRSVPSLPWSLRQREQAWVRGCNVCVHSCSFPLRANWRKSSSSVDGEPQRNWRRNLISRDVVASFLSFSRTTARTLLRARRLLLQSWTKLLRKCHILRAFFVTFSLYRVLPSPLPLKAMFLCVLKQP